MGVPLPEVIARASAAPADLIKEPQLGRLKPGLPADIACFRLQDGVYTFKDAANNEREASQVLVNTLTVVGGEILEHSEESETHPWVLRDLATVAALDEKDCC